MIWDIENKCDYIKCEYDENLKHFSIKLDLIMQYYDIGVTILI